jgi:hypothetical protein
MILEFMILEVMILEVMILEFMILEFMIPRRLESVRGCMVHLNCQAYRNSFAPSSGSPSPLEGEGRPSRRAGGGEGLIGFHCSNLSPLTRSDASPNPGKGFDRVPWFAPLSPLFAPLEATLSLKGRGW